MILIENIQNLVFIHSLPVLQWPSGDDVLHQHGVALHEDQLRHEVDAEPLQLPDLHVHSAQLSGVQYHSTFVLCDSSI